MDRLLCGDVGYGKTEVAMRAAFKAVLDGKQVAVLVPTTILADQHFRTFGRRFAAFPVTIELLSRFRSRAEQKTILEKVADGSIDILIATHRMLAKDLAFRDLGLLIVDEEQRFGVAQKERSSSGAPFDRRPFDVGDSHSRSLHLSLSACGTSIIETLRGTGWRSRPRSRPASARSSGKPSRRRLPRRRPGLFSCTTGWNRSAG